MVYTNTRCNRNTCCKIFTCQDTKCCSCFIPKSAGDSRRLIWSGAFVLFVAVLFLLSGIVIPPMLKTSFHESIQNAAVLHKKSPTFDLFVDNEDFPLQLEVYMYDVQNADDVVKKGAMPEIKEVGPFHYSIHRTAIDLQWTDKSKRLEWKYYNRYIFDRSKSVADESTIVTGINLPFFGIAKTILAMEQPDALNLAVTTLQADGGPYSDETNMAFVQRSVKEVLFGYDDDPLLNFLSGFFQNIIPKEYDGLLSHHASLADAQKQPFDGIYTGQGRRLDARYYYKFQDKITLNEPGTPCFWNQNDDLCAVRGSDGGAFGAPLNSTLDYPLFVSSFMRTVDLEYVNTFTRSGVELYRYRMSPKVFQNMVDNPENADFFVFTDGVLPMAPALIGLPLYITRPRYAGVKKDDPFLATTKIEFIEESTVDDVDTVFEIEPRTASTLSVTSTSMLNFEIGPVSYEIEEDDDDWFVIQQERYYQQQEEQQQQQQQQQYGRNHEGNVQSASQSASPSASACSFSPYSQTTHQCLSTLMSKQTKSFMNTITGRPTNQQDHKTLQEMITITYFPNMMETIYAPIFWANQYVRASDKDLTTLASLFRAADNTVFVLPIICFVAAGCFLLCASFLICRGWKYNKSYTTDGHVLYETPNAENYTPHKGYHETLDALDLDPIYATDFNTTPQRYNNNNNNRRHRATSLDQIRSPYSKSYGGVELKTSASALPAGAAGAYTNVIISDD